MGYAQYIGRIGALAVALGVTSAVAHPQFARADEPAPTGSSDAGSTNSGSAPDGGSADKGQATAEDDATASPDGGEANEPTGSAGEEADGADDTDSTSTTGSGSADASEDPGDSDQTYGESDKIEASPDQSAATADTDAQVASATDAVTSQHPAGVSPAQKPAEFETSPPAVEDDVPFTTRVISAAGLDNESLNSPLVAEPVAAVAQTLSTPLEVAVDTSDPADVAEVPPLESLALGVLGVLGGAGLDPTGTTDDALLAAAWALYRRQESSGETEDAIDEPADETELLANDVAPVAFALFSAPADEAPTAVNDTKAMTQGVSRTFSPPELLSNDTDPEHDALRVHSVADAVGGTAVLNADGTVTFNPATGFSGAASFTYTVEDAAGSVSANSATVILNVRPNTAPTATDDTKLLVQNVSRTFVPGELTYNDTDPEHDALRVHSVADAVGGTAVLNEDGTVTFTPETDYSGPASFTYKVKDVYGLVSSNSATVNLTVRANTAPTAGDDTKLVVQNVPRTLAPDELTYNDTDPEGDPRSIHSVDNAVGGTVVLNANGTVTFTPAPDYSGPASFTYRAKDSYGLASNSATVALTVRANTAPTAGDDAKLLVANVPRTLLPDELTYNDTDAESDWRILHSVDNAVGGTVVLNANGTVTFTPETDYSGPASFTYKVKDSYGLVSNSATVALTVRANTAPTAVDDTKIMVEDTPRTFAPGELTYNDTDPERDARSIHSVAGANGGTVVLNADGTVTFTPDADYNGPASFTYKVKDLYGAVSANAATVNLTILPVDDPDDGNHAPQADTPAYQYTTQLRSGILSGTVTVSDPDGDTLSFTMTNTPSAEIGSVVIDSATGAWAFRPTSAARLDAWTNPDGLGVHFTIVASDGQTSTPVEINVQVSAAAFFDENAAELGLAGSGDVIAVSVDGQVYLGGVGGFSVLNPDLSAESQIPLDFSVTDAAVSSDGRIYATDHEDGVVVVIDPVTSSVTTLASLSNAGGIAVDSAGKVYVTSSEDRMLTILNADGSVANSFEFSFIPTDVAVGPPGQIYLAEIAEDLNSVRVTLRDADLAVVKILYQSDSAPLGDYASPLGIVVGVNGAVYVSDPNQGKFAAFNKYGEPTDSLHLDGISRGIAVTADGIALLTHSLDGSLWVLTPGALENGDFDYTVDRSTGVVSGEVFVLDPGQQFTYEVSTAPDPLLGAVVINSATGAWEFTPTSDASFNAWLAQYDSSVDYQNQAEFAITASDGTRVLISAPIVGVANFDVDAISGVNGSPAGIALSSDGRIYVADRAGHSITVLNGDGTTLATVDLDFTPLGVSSGPSGLVIITNGIDNTLAILNISGGYTVSATTVTGFTGAITAAAFANTGGVIVVGHDADLVAAFLSPDSPVFTIDIDNPTAIDVGDDGSIYVVGTNDDGAGYLNIYGSDGILVSSTTLGGNPSGVSVGPNGLVYVTDANGLPRSLAIVGPDGAVSTTLDLGGAGGGVEASPDGRVYITSPGDGSVTVLSPPAMQSPGGTVGTVSTINTTGMNVLTAIAVTPDGQIIVTGADYIGGEFALGVVGETGAVTKVKPLSSTYSFGVEVGPDGQFYVSDYLAGTVTKYDPAKGYAGTLVASIPGALGLAFGSDGTLYVSSINLSGSTGALTTVNAAGKIVQTIALPGVAYDVTVAPDGRVLASYYSYSGAGSGILVRELDGTTSTITLPIGTIPVGVAVDADGTMYVADSGHQIVIARYASGLTRTVQLGGQPFGLALDDYGHLYVTSPSSSTITVLKLAGYANHAPTVSDTDAHVIGAGGVVSGRVAGADPDRDVLTYELASTIDPAVGTVTVNHYNGSWTFAPTKAARLAAGTSPGDDVFTFNVVASDGIAAATVAVTAPIVPTVSTTPQVGTPAFSIIGTDPSNGRVSGTVNVSDADDDALSYSLAAAVDSTIGSVTVDNATGAWYFIPAGATRNAAYVTAGDETITFTVNASDGEHSVPVVVSAPISPATGPEAGTPAFTITGTGPSGQISGGVNASDPDGDPLTYQLTTAPDPAVGYVTYDNYDGNWTFTPTSQARFDAANTVGDDTATFVLTASDGTYSTDITIAAPIIPNLDAPQAGTPAFAITGTGHSGVVYGTVNATDPDGDTVYYQLATDADPAIGYASVNYYGGWTFTPTAQARLDAANTAGGATATFVVTASDGNRTTNITVSAPIIPNLDAPQAGTPAFAITGTGHSGVVYGTVNATDPDGDTVYYQLATDADPAIGYASVNYYGGWTFTPTAQARLDAANTAGGATATFVIAASDGARTTDITVTAPIIPNLAAPEASTPSFTIINTINEVVYGRVNITDGDNDQIQYQIVPGVLDPAIGSVSVSYDGSWTFRPTAQARLDAADTTDDDTASFDILASDGGRSTTVTVVAPIPPHVNQRPIIEGSGIIVTNVDDESGVVTGHFSVNDPDSSEFPAFAQLTYSVTGNSGGGEFTIDSAGTFTFTPTLKQRADAYTTPEAGTATFTVTVSDGQYSDTANISVPVVALVIPASNQGLAVAPDGHIYYTTYLFDQTGRVVVLNPDQSLAAIVDIAAAVSDPYATAYDVAVGPDGRVFVSSEVGQSAEAVSSETGHGALLVIDPADHYTVTRFAEISSPASAIAVDGIGRVYVANWNDDNIVVFNADGSFNRAISSLLLADDDDSGVSGLALAPDGSLYLTKPGLGVVKVIDSNGSLVEPIDLGGAPWSVAISDSGAVYVTDFGANVVTVLTADRSVARTLRLPTGASPSDVTVADDGTLYVAYTNSQGSVITSVATAAPTQDTDPTQVGNQIVGSPSTYDGLVISGEVAYLTTTHVASDTGATVTTVSIIAPDGQTFTVEAPGEPFGKSALDASGTLYRTVQDYDLTTGTYRSGVLAVTPGGTSTFTGLFEGTPVGAVVIGADATAYQILQSHDLDTDVYKTKVVVIAPSGTTAHSLAGFAGNPLSGPFNAVVAPDGSVYLTTTTWTDDGGGITTTVATLGPTGITKSASADGFAGGSVVFGQDGTAYQVISTIVTDADSGISTFNTSVVVVTPAGLTALPGTAPGAAVGATSIAADGTVYQNVINVTYTPGPADLLQHGLESIDPDSVAWALDSTPSGIYVSDDHVIIASESGDLTVLGHDGSFVDAVSLVAGGGSSGQYDVVEDSTGLIFVSDSNAGKVWVVDPNADDAVSEFATVTGAERLAIDSTGYLRVLGQDSNGPTLTTFDLADRSALATTVELDIDATVTDMAIGPDGRIYVTTDTGLVVLNADGSSPMAVNLNDYEAQQVAVDNSGRIFAIAENVDGKSMIAVVGADGNYAGYVPIETRGPIAVGPDGQIFIANAAAAAIDVVTLPADLSPAGLTSVTTTAVAKIAASGISVGSTEISGTPIDFGGDALSPVVGPDGAVYLTTAADNAYGGDPETTIVRIPTTGAPFYTVLSGNPVGGVVEGLDGNIYQATYDASADVTRVAVISSSGSFVHEFSGYPGDPDSAVAIPPVVGPDGSVRQTLTSLDSATGEYITTVVTISGYEAAAASYPGLPIGPIVVGPDGRVYQTVTRFDYDIQAYRTSVVVAEGTSLTPIADIRGNASSSVAFGDDGTIYQVVSNETASGDSRTTLHILGQSATPALRALVISAEDSVGEPSMLARSTTAIMAVSATSSATVSSHVKTNGELFLQGKYIKLGISSVGSFGTQNGNVGFVYDRDGIGTGVNSQIDFYTPDAPEERWSVGFGKSSLALGLPTTYTGGFSRLAGNSGNATQLTKTSLTDTSSGNKLSGEFKTIVQGSLEVTQKYSFDVNGTYYITEVTVKNISDKVLKEVEFMRSFDPDNTRYQGGTNTTVNRIGGQYATDGFASVTASSETGDRYNQLTGQRAVVFYYSSDSRAIVYTGGFSNGNPYNYDDASQTTGYYNTADSAIGIVFKLGDLTPGKAATFSYYTGARSDSNAYNIKQEISGANNKNSVNTVQGTLKIEDLAYNINKLYENTNGGGSDSVLVKILKSGTTTRMIVYITGIKPDLPSFTQAAAVYLTSSAITGVADEIAEDYAMFHPSEIMLVGHSKGGMVAQKIAADSRYSYLPIKAVVTFGAPTVTQGSDKYVSVEIANANDPVANLPGTTMQLKNTTKYSSYSTVWVSTPFKPSLWDLITNPSKVALARAGQISSDVVNSYHGMQTYVPIAKEFDGKYYSFAAIANFWNGVGTITELPIYRYCTFLYGDC